MDRITDKHLQGMVDRINRVTSSPQEPYTRTSERLTSQVGNYHISHAYGGVCLHRMMNGSGGVTDVFRCGHVTKRDLYNRLSAYLEGLEQRA